MPGMPGMGPQPVPYAPPMPGNDPILEQLMTSQPVPPPNPDMVLPDTKRKGYRPLPEDGFMLEAVNSDAGKYERVLARMARDLMLYRQDGREGLPPNFDPKREVAYKSSTMSNVVNKFANMLAGSDYRYEVPFKDEQSREASRVVENFLGYCRKYEKRLYAQNTGGGNLQWDEFFYMLLHGRVVCRILPDPYDDDYPFQVDLLDPATCFPVFRGGKNGLARVTRLYHTTVSEVVNDYGGSVRHIEDKIADAIGLTESKDAGFYNHEVEVKEYWDTWNRAVFVAGVPILVAKHKLGFVPFVIVMAKGEPAHMTTPKGQYNVQLDEYDNAIMYVGDRLDLAQKGVSVFHHLVNTNRIIEVVHTLLLTEAIKASNPSTITYTAPQMAGNPAPPLNTKPGGNNQRVLNMQKVEAIPTSPRPTDVAPVVNKAQQEFAEGSLPPGGYGAESGSNISGFAVESLIAAAKDAILPYITGFETYQAMKGRMKLVIYRDWIAPVSPVAVPMEGKYGTKPTRELTPDMIALVGVEVECEMHDIARQQLPQQIQAAQQAVDAGFWTRRKAMEHLGDKDPDKTLADIIAERAMEHPEMMENFIIPMGFIKRGQDDLARMWTMFVVMPKMQQMMGMMMGGGGGMPGMPGGGGPPGMPGMPGGGGPQPNGQSQPMMGEPPPAPGGPAPGQGRGPAPQ